LEDIEQGAREAHVNTAREVREAPLTHAGVVQRLLSGSKEDAQHIATTKRLLAEHKGNSVVHRAAVDFRRQKALQHTNFLGATSVDLVDKLASNPHDHASWAGSYRDFKDRFKLSEGAFAE